MLRVTAPTPGNKMDLFWGLFWSSAQDYKLKNLIYLPREYNLPPSLNNKKSSKVWTLSENKQQQKDSVFLSD